MVIQVRACFSQCLQDCLWLLLPWKYHQVMSLVGWYILLCEKSERQLKRKYHRTSKIWFCVKLSLKGSVLVALLKVCEMIFVCLVM